MRRIVAVLCIAVLSAAIAGSAMAATSASRGSTAGPGERAANAYKLRRLVADQAGHAAATDPNLVNAWGLAAGPTTPWWVNAADSDVSTLYDGTGAILPLVVDVTGGPTGLVFNGGTNFVVSNGSASGPSLFLFSTEGGTVDGWNPGVPPPSPSTSSFEVADRSSEDANYKGLAIASTVDGDFLYATDFHNAQVDMFDDAFSLVSTSSTFVDPGIPDGYGPFGIQAIGDTIFVTYAKQDADAEDEVVGSGRGFVDAFDTDGTFVGRVATRHRLNAPWGLAMAPADFGRFSGALLVGNFGDGQIHAFRPRVNGSYRPVGVLRNRHGRVVSIDGLWAIAFGNGDAAGPSNALYFTAGPDDETHGLFGRITATG
ncbi:MAG: TIGR03118 family protein [Actinomycetota bacterium]